MRRLLVVLALALKSPLFQAFSYTMGGGVVGAWAGVQVYETVLQVASAMPTAAPVYGPTPVPSRTPNGNSKGGANAVFPVPTPQHA